ncbi:HTH-type transcriptional regulator YesS [Paenibacillus konkukensis]|uniref:HTH-type transcriptional regulator YesS n=2 Tax=Paenibacillus konkukensis TaxID=2020716 RepID=A0ABY4RX36_9BACL|nr:HTH-type transcriptional regulator YesS [Paenibacillus konkukensis]
MAEFVPRSIKPKSLFGKMLTGFLAVIVLLVAFNFVTSVYLKNKIHDEIVKYNELSINHTVEGYENHFRLSKNIVLGLNQNDRWMTNLNILRKVKENNGYASIEDIRSELKALYSNPFLQFENVIIYFRNDAYVVEKDGTSSAEDMFGKFYRSGDYPLSFWNRQFDERIGFRVLPASRFTEKSAGVETDKGLLLPMLMKPMPYNDMYMIVMLDAQKLFQIHNISSDQHFYILDPDGRPIYTTTPDMPIEPLSAFDPAKSSVMKGHYYYFFRKGPETGFTYVSMVPAESISLQLVRLNTILISLLAAAALVSIAASVLFSRSLHTPLRKIIDSLQAWDTGEPQPKHGPIREFDLIGHKVDQMMQTNKSITQDLAHKTSLLRKYALTNKLKNIHMNLAELREMADNNMPFMILLFEIHFKEKYAELSIDQEKGTYYIRECIDSVLLRSYEESVTFQMERNLVLSLIFTADTGPDSVSQPIDYLKNMFDVEHDLYLVTMAVSPLYPAASAFTEAYEEMTQAIKQRRLLDETQVIRGVQPAPEPYPFTVLMEEELHTRLMSGREEAVGEWIAKHVEQLGRRGASIEAYRQFAKEVALQTDKTLQKLNLHGQRGGASAQPSLCGLSAVYSAEQLKQWFAALLQPAVQLIRRHTEDQDPITRFVIDYLDAHLHEDITLDLMADKLKITPGYLSTYFKEKTGMNFSDYLNDLRIQRAKLLLDNLELKIQDVAAHVGYQNANSFIRMFKRYSGITPGEYRKKYASRLTAE